MKDIEKKLQSEAKDLLDRKKVDFIIGFEPGSLKFTTTPLITRVSADTQRLVVNPFIVNNLSVFLRRAKGKAGIVAKGCDGRSIVSLIQDKQIARENVVIMGVPCAGLIDVRKIEKLTGRDRDELEDISREDEKVTVAFDGKKSQHPITEVLFDKCLGCEYPTPKEYDILLGEPRSLIKNEPSDLKKINELINMTPERRWEFWSHEFSRCIRCNACRQVCPACSCQRCFVEETEPSWVSPLPRWQDNLMFQITRVIHVAGRCSECGECERACPAHIPLRSLTKQMSVIIDELFHYKAGLDSQAPPLMAAYEFEEAQNFMR